MKAGKNTPQSVLSYIDAILAKNEPPDSLALARELGYKPKAILRLVDKHGERLPAHLQKVKRDREEHLRYLARQNGLAHPPQYVGSIHGAICDEDAPTVPDHYQNVIKMASDTKWAQHEERERAEELARAQIRSISEMLREMNVQAARSGTTINPLLARLVREIKAESGRSGLNTSGPFV